MVKKIKIGSEYDTQFCFETVRIVVNKIIEDSRPSDWVGWDNACSVTIVGTRHNLLRRISELHEPL